MAAKPLPTPEDLHKMLEYDPTTGFLLWKPRTLEMVGVDAERRRWNARHAGKRAVTYSDKKGYCRGHIGGRMIYAHRIAWAMTYGVWPDKFIDHINGDRSDNRISNLRVVDKTGNMRNQRGRRDSASGVLGVSWVARERRWQVTIGDAGRRLYLGTFYDLDDAIRTRKEAEAELGYHPNHGRY